MPTSTSADHAIRESGLRRTTPRAVVAAVLERHTGHRTVGEILDAIESEFPGASGIAPASVYRALEALESVGLVVSVRAGQEEARFEWAGGGSHHHLTCEGCGHTSEVTLAGARAMEREARREYGFETRVRHLALRGLCRGCSARSRSGGEQAS